MQPVIFVVGPTACGKSDLSLRLAEKHQGGILNCDSLQVYKRLDIGTAKPTPQERSSVPHFLFDELAPGDVLTAGDFRRQALEILDRELAQRIIFAVGGSGFYIQALEKGMFEAGKPDLETEKQVREHWALQGEAAAYKELQSKDPEYAEEINPNDSYRILRALILMADSGQKMSELRRDFKPQKFPYEHLKLGLSMDREQLLPRVQARVQKMLTNGFLQEVEQLLNEGWSQWPPLQSVGYKECVDHLQGRLAADRLPPLIVERTMQLAKKQRTWFKRDPEIHWLNSADPFTEALERVMRFLDRSGRQS